MNHVWDDIMLKIHNNNDTWEIIEELIPGRRKDTEKLLCCWENTQMMLLMLQRNSGASEDT